jgi:hypothetical protein
MENFYLFYIIFGISPIYFSPPSLWGRGEGEKYIELELLYFVPLIFEKLYYSVQKVRVRPKKESLFK